MVGQSIVSIRPVMFDKAEGTSFRVVDHSITSGTPAISGPVALGSRRSVCEWCCHARSTASIGIAFYGPSQRPSASWAVLAFQRRIHGLLNGPGTLRTMAEDMPLEPLSIHNIIT
jgi:hypothetical protein